MCWVPAGEFEMGSPDDEEGHGDNESPVHDASFRNGFWMGKYEVTQAQWEAVMDENPAHDRGFGDNYPVYYVSWDDIQDFESELDNEFRLPTESEWEYACRAETQTRFYWGDDIGYYQIDDYAVQGSNPPGSTAEVGAHFPNTWGFHDMSGNVFEWCEDVWHNDYNGAPDNGDAWIDGGVQSRRILRGGSWNYSATTCRSANRDRGSPDNGLYFYGFRLVRDAD